MNSANKCVLADAIPAARSSLWVRRSRRSRWRNKEMRHTIEEIIIESVQEFVAFVDQQKDSSEKAGNDVDFLFRGQRRDLPLLPKISRLDLRGEITNIEKLINVV